jgi:hypothetical protein
MPNREFAACIGMLFSGESQITPSDLPGSGFFPQGKCARLGISFQL